LKFLFDLLPVLLFFAVFKLGGAYPDLADLYGHQLLGWLVRDGAIPAGQAPILLATAVAIVVSLLQVGWVMARGRHVEPMLWISMAVIVVFGGATIWLHDEIFIKWKPTILYALFGAILGLGHLFWQRNLVRSAIGLWLARHMKEATDG
jgi:intracellular septation protein